MIPFINTDIIIELLTQNKMANSQQLNHGNALNPLNQLAIDLLIPEYDRRVESDDNTSLTMLYVKQKNTT